MIKNFFLLVGTLALVSGCATRVAFTHQMRSEYNLDTNILRGIQFYVSDPITLRRQMNRYETSVTSGHKLKVYRDERTEEVIIKKNAPGVVVNVEPDTLAISFEEGKSLVFCSDPKHRNEWGGKYIIAAEEWKGDQGKLQYGGQTYSTTPTTGYACLLVDLRSLNKFKKETRTVHGRKLH